MNTTAKPRTNIFTAIGRLFSSEIDVEEMEEIQLPTELSNVLKNLIDKEKRVEQAINAEGKLPKKGGFGKKINPNTEKAMRAMYKEVQKASDDKERG